MFIKRAENDSAQTSGNKRRSPRVPVNFEIVLEWRESENVVRQVSTTVVRISRGGATIISHAGLEIGTRVRLTAPFGATLEAEVNGVWVDKADGLPRVGVRLLSNEGWFE